MVRLFLQVKAGPKSTKSCFSYCYGNVLYILHSFEHHKANLIKRDISRLERLFSGQFEELKHKDVSRNYLLYTVSEEKHDYKERFTLCSQNWKKKMKTTCR